jgi:hypothetical protein
LAMAKPIWPLFFAPSKRVPTPEPEYRLPTHHKPVRSRFKTSRQTELH